MRTLRVWNYRVFHLSWWSYHCLNFSLKSTHHNLVLGLLFTEVKNQPDIKFLNADLCLCIKLEIFQTCSSLRLCSDFSDTNFPRYRWMQFLIGLSALKNFKNKCSEEISQWNRILTHTQFKQRTSTYSAYYNAISFKFHIHIKLVSNPNSSLLSNAETCFLFGKGKFFGENKLFQVR